MMFGRACVVCNGPGCGCFFRVYSCRPCASFFRRSIRDRREYVCRQQGKCPINKEGMRNSCRACRLKLCLEAGMRPDLAKNVQQDGGGGMDEARPNQIGGVFSSSSTCSSSSSPLTTLSSPFDATGNPHSVIVTLRFSMATPLCQQIAKCAREYEEGQKAIVAQHFGLNVAIGQTIRLVTHSETMQLEKCCAPLLMTFVRSQFPEFDNLIDTRLKTELMKKFMMHFTTLTCFNLTLRTFSDDDELTQFLIYPGCAGDMKNKCENYFKTVTGIGRQQQIDLSIPLMDRYMKYMLHVYKPLRITPLESAALSGILLWNCVHHFLSDKHCQPRDALFVELHTLAIQHSLSQPNADTSTIPIRFGQLMNVLMEITSLDKDLGELLSLSKVFLDPNSSMDFTTIWDGIFDEKTTTTRNDDDE